MTQKAIQSESKSTSNVLTYNMENGFMLEYLHLDNEFNN